MKTQKISYKNIKDVLSRDEMKKIMAGSGTCASCQISGVRYNCIVTGTSCFCPIDGTVACIV